MILGKTQLQQILQIEKMTFRHTERAITFIGTQHSLAKNVTASFVEGKMLLHHTGEYHAVMEDILGNV